MKQANKKAREELSAALKRLRKDLDNEINMHGREIKKRVEEQQVRKRKRQEFDRLIYALENK